MDAHTYPGRGLSLQQLVFALNEELKRVAYFPSFASDTICQLDRDASTALATIREWRNSFAPINRIPLDILPLIPTFLSSQRDRFHAASVCRHWRTTFLHHGPIWSQLFLRKGEVYVRTLLERAKGSALDVTIRSAPPPVIISQLSAHFQQIRRLELSYAYWEEVIKYSETISGPLPLLRTLIVTPREYGPPNTVTITSLPLFGGAVYLKQFIFTSKKLHLLGYFIFPNLTTFELSTRQTWTSNASSLFNFLKASPKLRTVEITLDGRLTLESVPRETVTVLPNVETFSLYVGNDWEVYKIAARISCPRAKYTSLTHSSTDHNYTRNLKIFPTPDLWSAISCQYTRSPVEEVTLEINPDPYGGTVACSLTSQSSDATVVKFCFRVDETGEDGVHTPFEAMDKELFSRACSAAQGHPSLSHVKRLHIKHRAAFSYPDLTLRMSDDVGDLFDPMGPLEELTIHDCDLRIFVGSFLDLMGPNDFEIPVPFPHIKKLTISHPFTEINEEECLSAIVDLAESQHQKGIPFERVTVRAEWLPTGMAERLREWVDVVECYEEDYQDEG